MKYASKNMLSMVISALLAGAAFFLFYVFLQFVLPIAVLFTFVLFVGFVLILGPRKVQIGTIDLTDMANSEETAEILETGMKALESIRLQSQPIKHAAIKDHLANIHALGQRIFQQLGNDPSQIKHVHRFFSYYLDVTLKLIDKYQVMVQSNVMVQTDVGLNDSSIKPVVEKLETTFALVESAFSKQLDRLLAKDIMDVDVEMKVLENLLKEEG